MPKNRDNPAPTKPTIGITMGDPCGIGPEVIIKALTKPQLRTRANFVIYGMNELLAYAADLAEITPYWWRAQADSDILENKNPRDVLVLDFDEFSMLGQSIHRPTRQGGEASLAFIDRAIKDAQKPAGSLGRLDAIVTAPVCKESWGMAGKKKYPGHTELFQNKTHAKRAVMMFVGEKLRVALATVHIPLLSIGDVLTIGKVFDAIDLGNEACLKLGIEKPKIAVCGLNPHASENGMFGCEEERVITPAITMAREQGCDVHGPFPGDTIFIDALQGKYDLVVAMYHDQGLIPVKLLEFDKSVNVTLGLPLIRTSVDHGTAFDIVGKNQADPGSMIAAIKLAIDMVQPVNANNQ